MEDRSKVRGTHLRVDFVVKEVSPDGSVPEADLRYVAFGDDVAPHLVRDFFERSGLATSLMFTTGTCVMHFTNRPANIIHAVKALRSLMNCTLQDAKRAVDVPVGTPFMLLQGAEEVKLALAAFDAVGVSEVAVRPFHHDDGIDVLPRLQPRTVP